MIKFYNDNEVKFRVCILHFTPIAPSQTNKIERKPKKITGKFAFAGLYKTLTSAKTKDNSKILHTVLHNFSNPKEVV